GHDIEKICKNLDKLHEIRIKYFHHWLYEEKGNVIEDARNCIKFLYEAIGDIFECDDDKQSGVLFVNKRILDWINKSSNDKA
ncbi:MAG: hypothetical protein EBT55_03275, partial [Proteobacteria bacterium]|nr:hypothetical protein [Pseudomonadota bacterium]